MITSENHEELLRGISDQQAKILESSGQAVYIYLDDNHIVYNQKFVSLLGYTSPGELEKFKGSFLPVFVAEKSRDRLADAYQKTVDKLEASSVEISWKQKEAGEIRTTVLITPLIYEGHRFAIHYIY